MTLHYAMLQPIIQRFQKGEGGLWIFSVFVIVLQPCSWFEQGVLILLSLWCLALLYAYNDFHDCHQDRRNPKKNQPFTTYLCEYQATLMLRLKIHAFVLLMAYTWMIGIQHAVLVGLLLLLNTGYSRYFKGIPGIDLAAVALWGGLYVGSSGADVPLPLLLIAGSMTGISHIYQMLEDQYIDQGNTITTTAVASSPILFSHITLLDLGLMLCYTVLLSQTLQLPFLLSLLTASFLGISLWLIKLKPHQSHPKVWLLSKAYFAALWCLMLGEIYGA